MNAEDKPRKRLFFALWPRQGIRDSLAETTQPLITSGRRVVPSNLHLTLVFIGMADESYRSCLEQVANQLTGWSGFTLRVCRVGVFPKPRILWIGLDETPEPLIKLQRSLATQLISCGYVAETRPYRPHITLARKFLGPPPSSEFQPLDWRVESFSLMESLSTESGVIYRELKRWPLEPCQ